MSVFRFKKFSLADDNTPMKIGMDSVILGAWATVFDSGKALDIGSGCGLLSFMIAQRSPALEVTGVEIYEPAYDDAVDNLSEFPPGYKIRFFNADIKDWHSDNRFDLIITNPPYFKGQLKPAAKGRSFARFQDVLPAESLVEKAAALLKETGRFALIIPLESFFDFNKTCVANGLFLYRKTVIRHRAALSPKRVLLEYGFDDSVNLIDNELIIKNVSGEYSREYKLLTRDFYLDF